MAALIHLDSHVLVWLYAREPERLSEIARECIRAGAREHALAVSPVALLEITYLKEIGRLGAAGPEVLSSLSRSIGLHEDETPFSQVVATAHDLDWTRDPFDRLIAAQALCSGAELITADETIRANLPSARW